MKPQKKKAKAKNARRHKPVDRSQQGAALSGSPNISLDSPAAAVVESQKLAAIMPPSPAAREAQKAPTMILTLTGLNRKNTYAFYAGTPGTVHISLSAFPNKTAPEMIEVADGVFAVKAVKVAKVKLTKEQRAALPKPTAAEQIAKMEQRLAAARAKLAAKAAAAAGAQL